MARSDASRSFEFTHNGRAVRVEAEPGMPLLWVLRDLLGATGTKYGCGRALCGACAVLLDGREVRSCALPVSAAAGREVTTVEGLEGPVAQAVRRAWLDLSVPQCGYCQSGQIIAATALLARDPEPDEAAVDAVLAGHLCRCATYGRIRAAVQAAARSLSQGDATGGDEAGGGAQEEDR